MKKILNVLAWVLVIVGAINWGLIGILNFDLVAEFLGEMSTASRVVYSIVGVAGLWTIFTKFMKK